MNMIYDVVVTTISSDVMLFTHASSHRLLIPAISPIAVMRDVPCRDTADVVISQVEHL